MSGPGTLLWFARHECRLAWRDWLSMVTAGRRRRMRSVGLALVAFAAFMHLLAYSVVGRFAGAHDVDAGTLVVITGTLLGSLAAAFALQKVALEGLFRFMKTERRSRQ